MKKTAAMLLALLLFALPVLGQAAKLKEYTHPTYGYSLQHPSDWLVVDAENIDGYIAAYENGTLRHGAADAETLFAELRLRLGYGLSDEAVTGLASFVPVGT